MEGLTKLDVLILKLFDNNLMRIKKRLNLLFYVDSFVSRFCIWWQLQKLISRPFRRLFFTLCYANSFIAFIQTKNNSKKISGGDSTDEFHVCMLPVETAWKSGNYSNAKNLLDGIIPIVFFSRVWFNIDRLIYMNSDNNWLFHHHFNKYKCTVRNYFPDIYLN